jgi:hypothetical protein
MMFNLPARTFKSFMEAALEVGDSRLYGGIHYRLGNEAGTRNGQKIGAYISETVKTKR